MNMLHAYIVKINIPIEISFDARNEQDAIIGANDLVKRFVGLEVFKGYNAKVRICPPVDQYKAEKNEIPF